MSEKPTELKATLALNTELERQFIAPLTSVQSALEILRDYSDLSEAEYQRFITIGLQGCAQLTASIADLAGAVYDSPDDGQPGPSNPTNEFDVDLNRIIRDEQGGVIEIDLSDFRFESADAANRFYDGLEAFIQSTGRKWYFVINQTNFKVWPEAWVAAAHRGKKFAHACALGTVRYVDETAVGKSNDPEIFASKHAAMAEIIAIKSKNA